MEGLASCVTTFMKKLGFDVRQDEEEAVRLKVGITECEAETIDVKCEIEE